MNDYHYRTAWLDEGAKYVGLCAEFPSLSWLACTQEKALSGIRLLAADCIVDMEANNEPPPKPITDNKSHYLRGEYKI